MSATSGGGGSVSEGSEAGGSSQSTMSVGESPSTSFQPNLVENVTKITLSEENGGGGFAAADVTGSKINLSVEERQQQKDGIVNVAFDYEDETNRNGAGSGSAGVVAGGDFRSINGSEKKDKLPEAVNLELVNMVPYSNGNGTSYGVPVNGIPVKKDSEQVDMSTPYDEYFVPVNEHKKYMRGEKLYVTKDKRRPTSWRRCLSWIVACTVISVVLILAILAGTGVILSQEPDLVKDASVGRNFAGNNLKQSVTNKTPSPTAEMYMYVPRSIESEFVIDNLDFDPAFKNLNSTAYKEFATMMEDQLKMLLFDKETLEFGASDVGLKVVNVSRDPFKVNYRIGWNYKQGVNNPPEPIKMEDVKKRLVESLTRNQGYIDKYHIDSEAIKVNHVVDTCQMENGGCSHICYYNYNSQQFVCTCPTHLVLDNSGKNCVAWTGSSEDDALPVPSHTGFPGMPYDGPSTTHPVHEHEITADYDYGLQHQQHHHDHSGHSSGSGFKGYGEDGSEPTPEPGSGSPGTYEHGIHSSQGIDEHGGAPEPTAEPDAKNKYDHSDHDHSTHDNSGHDHSHHGGYSVYESMGAEAEPKPEPTAEGDHATHILYETKQHEPSAEPTPEPTAEHDGQKSSEGRGYDHDGHSPYGVKDYSEESTPEPASDGASETTFDGQHHSMQEPAPEPTAEGDSDVKTHDHVGFSVHGFKDHEPSAEPTPEPSAEDDSVARGHGLAGHTGYVSGDHHEPSAEPTPEPTAEGDSASKGRDHVGHSVHESKDHEPSAEPTPEPTADGDAITDAHGHGGHSVYESKDHEPAAEPTPEPTAVGDHTGKDHSQTEKSVHGLKDHGHLPSAEPTAGGKSSVDDSGSEPHEPSAEPTPEPTAEGDSVGKSHGLAVHSVHETKDHEPSAEPTPEPTGEGDSVGKSHGLAVHSVHETKDHEPSAEPTPEPSAEDVITKDHGHVSHSIYDSKNHESSAEPTTGDSTVTDQDQTGHSTHRSSDKESSSHITEQENSTPRGPEQVGHSDGEPKDHEPSAEPTPQGDSIVSGHIDHSSHETKDHEPSAEPTPEPTADDSITKDHGHTDHSGGEPKDHEPSAEPTPEPTAEDDSITKDHGHTDHSGGEPKHHEPSAEPTPEPTAGDSTKEGHDQETDSEHKDHEPSAEPTPEPTAEGDSVSKDLVGHSAHGTKDHEPSAEPTAEGDSVPKDLVGHSAHETKEHEPSAEPTPEVEATVTDHYQTGHSVHEPKGHEPSAESTPKPTAESDSEEKSSIAHTTHGVKDQEFSIESTTKPEAGEQGSSGIVPTDQNSSMKSTSEGGNEDIKMLSIPVRPSGSQSTTDNSDSSAKDASHLGISPVEHMNEGQDKTQITESRTAGVPTTNNESEKKHDPFSPHLEDILIRRPTTTSENQGATGHNSNPLDNVELTEDGKPVIEEVIIDGSRGKSTSGHPSTMSGHTETQSNTDSSVITSDSGDHSHAVSGSNDGTTKAPVVTNSGEENSTDHPKIVEYNSQESSTPRNVETGKSGSEPNGAPGHESTATGTDKIGHGMQGTQKSIHPTQEKVPVTTINPQIQTEYQTIPVFVASSDSGEANTETKPIQEGATSVTNSTHSETLSSKPGIMETDHIGGHPVGVRIMEGIGPDQTKSRETSTESQPSETTLLTILTPEGVGKLSDHLTKGPTATGGNDKAVNLQQSQTDGNETTKSPEEISNTIKDELSENEEFNTLLGKDYKNTPTEGKDAVTKYPNKSLKPEKKIKDYTKGDKSSGSTIRPPVTPEDFILQKHVNGNENIYDLDYSLQNEHTTKHHGEVTIVDPHSIDGVPGVSFKPHGINNHDISVLQTVAPDFRTETTFSTGGQDPETLKPDSKTKFTEKDGQTDKDYPKFEKDYKYDKQKVSKKKELKKKTGGKDGKNVELGDGRRYFTDVTKDDFDTSQEDAKDLQETTANPSFEKITVQPETKPGSEIIHEFKVRTNGAEATITPVQSFEVRTDAHGAGITELPGFKFTNGEIATRQQIGNQDQHTSVDQTRHLMIDEPTVKSSLDTSPGTVFDGQFHETVTARGPEITQINTTYDTPGTVFDGMPYVTTRGTQGGENPTFVEYKTTNSKTAHPTIIIHGQSGSLQDGHAMRFIPGNATVVSVFNGTLTHPAGHSFSFTNYTATFPNGSSVNPTIVVRGQSGTLQDGHQSRFGNVTFVTSSTHPTSFRTSNVYRIENGTGFEGNFNPQNGQYVFTNATGTFLYTNGTVQPSGGFTIRGDSGDFGNSTAYIIGNHTRTTFSGGFVGPQSVIFRNSTVFAVESDGGLRHFTVHPHNVTSNETIQYTNQMFPSFISSGTAYKVNDYFGYISKCAAGQFQCLNGTSKRGSACISLSSKCDSIPDCSDGSDELGCIENGCPGNFQCADGTCLKRNLVCNGIVDCSDASDEKNCENWKCEFDEFQCPSGRCIPVVWQCDGKPDCENHTDEYNCQTSCGNDEYLCPEGWCVPSTYKCNGVKECSNGEDEQLCDCSHEEFKCNAGGCVSMNLVCNGLDDCPDRSDEWDCVKLEPDTNLLKIRSPSGNYEPVCADGWSSRFSDGVCASLGYFSSVPIENENGSSITTDSSFYVLKNGTTGDFRKVIVNLMKSKGNCSSGKLVEISCQEFSCGSRSMTDSSSVEARLVGGMSAASGQWPSVSLLYNMRNFHSCTANVLTPRWVLASYNCLKMGNKNLNEQDWKFFGGSTVFEAEKENAETRKILRVIPHPQVKFNQFLFSNDLALVELDESLQFTSNVGAVCLPEQEIQPRQICVTAGWGLNGPEDKAIRQQLQYLPVPTMNLTECNSTEHYAGFITDDKICAGYNSAQKSLCYNEEGAPLMCVNDRGEWELQGVLSYHSNCGRGSHPSIFSSITPVADWIKKTIGNNFDRKTLPVTKR